MFYFTSKTLPDTKHVNNPLDFRKLRICAGSKTKSLGIFSFTTIVSAGIFAKPFALNSSFIKLDRIETS
jgi:hypothetical protein